jgi:DNA polymerase sigma
MDSGTSDSVNIVIRRLVPNVASALFLFPMDRSPKSDLDMCLQMPPGSVIADKDDPSGSKAMGELALMLEKNNMKDVDTSRLTARIPVIKFNFPKNPDNGTAPSEEDLLECDLSMHNPLAVLNTALLRTYADINPVARVLAGVVKRWAKARDINNPARHTLSSYGYIIMLLHFLTFHERSGNGLVTPLSSRRGKGDPPRASPLLPNLQWMDGKWPEHPPGTPYTEYADIPKKFMQHPLESKSTVNTHFYRTNPALLNNLQRLFPGQDLSLGILLASFFRYYAYEFDYKRHVVSLHSAHAHGPIEREVKAELDGWRNYSAALTIEDPFETFYDVAHVLRGGYYHRIRREFAVAYSKISDIAMGKTSSNWGNGVDLTKMDGRELVEWICEPVANERDEALQTT